MLGVLFISVGQQAIAESIKIRRQYGYIIALGFGFGQSMLFMVVATTMYVGGILVGNGTITFANFFQAFFAVNSGAYGVGQVCSATTRAATRVESKMRDNASCALVSLCL